MRQRNGFARSEHGKFETLESRSLLAGHGSICIAPSTLALADGDAYLVDSQSSQTGSLQTSRVSSASVTVDRVPVLHSHPAAKAKIFLDFNGHIVHGTGWNELNQGAAIHAPAFDIDGDANSFDSAEIELIERVWTRVAEDFAPFDVDVTTEAPSTRLLRAGSQAIRVLVSSNVDSVSGRTWMHSGNGVAYLNSWRSATDTPVWVFANRLGASDKRIAESVSHEVGHAFGLQHDGLHYDGHSEGTDGVEEYFAGHGDGLTGWAPIMGLGYHRPVTQWNSGEYSFSDNAQDDIATIASDRNGIRLRVDDFSDYLVFAAPIGSDENGRVSATGLISTRDDRDAFRLDVGSGTIDIVVSPAAVGANLDIAASLYDSDGRVIATFDSDTSLSARIQTTVAAGTYFLSIDGVGRGDPSSSGYSDYGSLGQYTITGAIPGTQSFALDGGAVVEDDGIPSVLAQIRLAARRLPSLNESDSSSDDVLAKWLALQTQPSHAGAQIRATSRRLRFS